MVIGLLTLELHLPGSRSLKAKRQVLRKLMERLRNRYNVAVAEVEHHDLWQRARVAVVGVNTDHTHMEATLDRALRDAEAIGDLQVVDAERELW